MRVFFFFFFWWGYRGILVSVRWELLAGGSGQSPGPRGGALADDTATVIP